MQAILAWAVRGCLDWQAAGGGLAGLSVPLAVVESTAAYQASMDPLAVFLADRTIVDPMAWTSAAALKEAYEAWHAEDGPAGRPLSPQALGKRLAARGFASTKGTGGMRRWVGIGLATGF